MVRAINVTDPRNHTQLESFSLLALGLLDSGVILIDREKKIVLWNQWMEDVSGISQQHAVGNRIEELFKEKKTGRLLQAIDYALERRLSSLLSSSLNRYVLPLLMNSSSGLETQPVAQSITVKPLIDQQENRLCLVHISNVTDVVKRESMLKQQGKDLKQLAHENAVSEQRVRSIIESTLDGIITFNRQGSIQSYNPAAALLFSLPLPMKNDCFLQSLIVDLNKYSQLPIDGAVKSLGYTRILAGEKWPEAVGINSSGDSFPVEISVTPMNVDEEILFTAVIRDISERQESEKKLTQLARYDFLTGLANRSFLYERLELSIMRVKRDGHLSALVFIDLDRFKNINDTLGHSAGDELLKHFANCLNDAIRDVDLAARLGGDEFAVILENSGDKTHITHAIERICKSLATPLTIEGSQMSVSCSLGISIIDSSISDCDELVKSADVAMYHAKAKGRDNYQFFTSDLRSKTDVKLSLESALQKAINDETLDLNYQPIFDIKEKKLAGIETLMRWNHPELGNVSPATFIPLMEETGLIGQAGEWVLKTACHQLKLWHDQGLVDEDCSIAVNFSARQFKDFETVKMIQKILTESQLPSHLLDIELTESTLMASHRNPQEILEELKNVGLKLSIDDFGTGYSSLSYLKQFPINNLKIDRSFIEDLNEDSNSEAIVKTIIDLAHNLGLTVIAEGIEDVTSLRFLENHDCRMVQGFLLAKPMSKAQFEDCCRRKIWEQETFFLFEE